MTQHVPADARTPDAAPWWRDAVCYQVYVRSLADASGDGLGDVRGITSRLDHLVDLGVDAVWLTPFYLSPQHDHGYDVADYRRVDPTFGDLADLDDLLAAAHERGLRMIVDLVPNHSSEEHPWFRAALAAGPGSPERARYVFREGRGPDGAEPPNNWRSVFGGSAWSRVEDGWWYLHLFDASQPDFDWTNPEVGDEFESVLRFWLDRGVDGFRIDVAHGLFKADGLPDVDVVASAGGELEDAMHNPERPYWDQPAVHDVYRRWHDVLAEYDGDRMAIAEAWVASAEAMARYVRPDELQQVFNFHFLEASWSAAAFREVVEATFAATDPVGASPTWVLSNHDVVRPVTRYGGGAVGTARARAAMLTVLGLPGSAYLYYGEELGLPQVDVAPEDRQDPTYLRGGGIGRDGCRIPMPWGGDAPPYDFGPGDGQPWLPQPPEYGALSVEAQTGDDASTLELVRRTLAARRTLLPSLPTAIEQRDRHVDVLAYVRGSLTCVVNTGDAGHDLADLLADASVVVCSGDLDGSTLPPDTAVWLRTP